MKIAMWSGPRNLSTAMMYAFSARSDCTVVDEPFYAAYLKASGQIHPMQEQILASQPNNADDVIAQCCGPNPSNTPLFYQKHMTHHMLPEFDLSWIENVCNVFLIRHPARVIASYHKKREFPTLEDLGIPQQIELFERVSNLSEKCPLVIDSDDILADPEHMLVKICSAIGIPFEQQMLNWQAGGNKSDGVWAPHWYSSVWKSSGLEKSEPKPLPELNNKGLQVLEMALPTYKKLSKFKL